MNETLQQFCQRILPVVQAGAEGKAIECSPIDLGDDFWLPKDTVIFNNDMQYRIAKPKATPLPITPEMWAMIDQKYKWAVLVKGAFEKTNVVFTAEKPERNAEMWDFSNVITLCFSPLTIDTTGIVPELSMTERPRIVSYADCIIDGGCDVHGADVHVNNAGEVKGAECDPDLTKLWLERLSYANSLIKWDRIESEMVRETIWENKRDYLITTMTNGETGESVTTKVKIN